MSGDNAFNDIQRRHDGPLFLSKMRKFLLYLICVAAIMETIASTVNKYFHYE